MSQTSPMLPGSQGASRAQPRRSAPHRRPLQLDAGRLNGFSDGIFAFAATLLVLQLVIPESSQVAQNQLGQYLKSSHFPTQPLTFVISFLVVAAYRTAHHRLFVRIAFVDDRLIQLNTVFLLFIAFLPFTTGLFSSFSVQLAFNLYPVNLALAGLLLVVMDGYTKVHPAMLLGPQRSWAQVLGQLVTPAFFLLSMLLALVNVTFATISWAFIGVVAGALSRVWPQLRDDDTEGAEEPAGNNDGTDNETGAASTEFSQ